MDIDLLVTPEGEAGLLCSKNLFKKAVGALLDTQSGVLSFEFADMDHMDLNIPIEDEFYGALNTCALIHIGSVIDGKIAQAYQVPLMFLDDPYRADAFKNTKPPKKPLAAFEYFIRRCVLGQPVNRTDAGDEETSGCILGDTLPSSLQFAPHLARRHSIEVAPTASPHINAPGMGMGGNTSGGGGYYRGGSSHYTQSDDDD